MIRRLTVLDIYCNYCQRSFGSLSSEPNTKPSLGRWLIKGRQARQVMKAHKWSVERVNGVLIDLCPGCKERKGIG
jgi:hypothetical protein